MIDTVMLFFPISPFISIQIQIYKNTKDVPGPLKDVLDQDTLEKARVYALDKESFGFWHDLYGQLESSVSTKLYPVSTQDK